MSENLLEYELHKGLFIWYPFEKESRILCIGTNDSIVQMLIAEQHKVTFLDYVQLTNMDEYTSQYDYIIAIEVVERVTNPRDLLSKLRLMLKEEGCLLLGTDNRLGLRYFCGDREPFSGTYFDGIEGYIGRNANDILIENGRCYAKNEILKFIEASGFCYSNCYSVLPNLDMPQLIYSEDFLPTESLANRYTPIYRSNEMVFLRERYIYDTLVSNGMFHQMANSYLIECRNTRRDIGIKHVTLSIDRGRKLAKATIVKENCVEKKALFAEGREELRYLKENDEYLEKYGVSVVESKLVDGVYQMPYESAKIASVYLQELMETNLDLFIQRMDEFRDLVLHSSNVVENKELGPILERGFIDLIPLNCFWKDDKYLVYDQEFYIENLPLNVILLRTIIIVYNNSPIRQAILPKEFFYNRYKMRDKLNEYKKIETEFRIKLRNQDAVQKFNYCKQADLKKVEENRKLFVKERESVTEKKMENLIKADCFYREYRENCFRDMEGKNIYVFGAGKFADKFLALYKRDYNIVKLVDNNKDIWGTTLWGLPIVSPQCLKEEKKPFKVIICVKQYESILCQLKEMGVEYIGIYDAHYIYPGRQDIVVQSGHCRPKKYRVGYVSGVFDLFHIGHINMLRRAKEQCDYLIAAVTSDEYVRLRKKREPFIPFEERLEVVRACKYVDEAVGVPYKYMGTIEAFEKYHFDCQFCGSDYQEDPWWLKQKEYLQSHGSDLVFLSYTEQTSSTKIKSLIEQKLL